jgi:dienelactone hydrolase
VIDWALTEGPHVANIDATKVAAMGHSFGGKIAFYAASLDDRIDLAVGWDPQNSGGPPCFLGDLAGGSCDDFPVAPNCEADDPGRMHLMHAETLVFATEDETITPDAHLRAWNFYRGAPSPASYVHFGSAGHAAWTTNGEVSALTRRVHTATLLSRLAGWRGLNDWLPGGGWLNGQRLVDDHRVK